MKRAITYLFTFLGVIILLPGIFWLWGLLLPEHHTVSVSQTFQSPPKLVYDVLTDIRSYPSWRSDLIKVELSGGDGGPQEWIEYYTDNDPLAFRINKPDSSLIHTEIVGNDLTFGGHWFFYLEKYETGSKLTITEKGEVYNPLFRFISTYFMGHDTAIRQFLADLEKELESDKAGT